ncbi:MAG: hypothetical protein ACK4PR_08455 [Gammaproteobacteria bacterium]
MAEPIINHLHHLINRQIDLQENLNEHLDKTMAMANVSLSDEFVNNPINTIYYYLWSLHDMIETAHRLNELSLSTLLKLNQQLAPLYEQNLST